MNWPNRRSNARAEPVVVMPGTVRTFGGQYKHDPIGMPRIRENEPDKVVLRIDGKPSRPFSAKVI
jgi:hypothetical protein